MLNWEGIEEFFKDKPGFRLRQVKKLIFEELITDWEKATVFPLAWRKELEEKFSLRIEGKIVWSEDKKTGKAVISLADGLKIEAVLMQHGDGRRTVCGSTQVGCPLGCKFCATGKRGFSRNLTAGEIVGQVLFFERYLQANLGKGVTNVVLMGMGEPFLNYEAVLAVLRILNDPEGWGLGARRLSISTSGVVPGIKKLAEEPLQVNLAVSLHAPTNVLRDKLMPVNKKYPIEEVLAAVFGYIKKTRRKVMIEYLMLEGVNDSLAEAAELAKLLKGKQVVVNLIAYNPTGTDFRASSTEVIGRFKRELEKRGLEVSRRYEFGQKTGAACGQLAGEE